MIHKTTSINQIEKIKDGDSAGIVQVRIRLGVVDTDGSYLKSAWHRTMLPPAADVEKQMAIVNADLVRMGYPEVSQSEIADLRAECDVLWTPDVVSAYQQIQSSMKL